MLGLVIAMMGMQEGGGVLKQWQGSRAMVVSVMLLTGAATLSARLARSDESSVGWWWGLEKLGGRVSMLIFASLLSSDLLSRAP